MKTITKNQNCQILVDVTPGGRLNPWQEKKQQSIKLAESHYRLSELQDFDSKAGKILDCGSWLEFRSYENGEKKLNRARFCKYRLCPMCSWRRSLKLFGQASQVLDAASNQGFAFLFVTLTLKNCLPAQLSETINTLFQSYNRLIRRKPFIRGGLRVLEVTHNLKSGSKNFGTYHPHIHAIWAVKSTYFKTDYINQRQLSAMWQQALGVDYSPICHITRAATAGKGHIREVVKYSVKPADILHPDPGLTDSAVWHLDQALKGRRLISWTGCLKTIRAAFGFDDPETGDLINVDGDIGNPDLGYILERYNWHLGYNQYIKKAKP